MTIRERRIIYAFALIENAKQTLGLAMNVLGNFPYDNGRGNMRHDIDDILTSIEKVRLRLDRIGDSVTDWKSSGFPYTLDKGGTK